MLAAGKAQRAHGGGAKAGRWDGAVGLEAALEDGWCHALLEDTGQYRIMCCNCQMELQQQSPKLTDDEDIDF